MNDDFATVHFPVAGIDVSGPFGEQRPRPLPQGDDDDGAAYGRTCAAGKNVRTLEASTLRRRGGSRPGIVKYIPARIAGTNWSAVQELAAIVTSAASAVG